ncbi:histone h1-binding protein [Grosmannia clavigera kw1407]|uniref:Histone h1-binding protein n=1 Tax=Grosmannia clavigera (strain kw1407 / UAMH 11150) TaxID=655863 RepID=F0XLP9_GROCL|nr:histone h1-binding protein [Grosmannia clavigera kw1407]EFX01390.1 histone h1-binding protein [Grosmannia clavigera kw1407]
MAENATESHDAAPAVLSAVLADIGTSSGMSTPGGPTTGTVTPALSELPPDQAEYSLRVSLADLCAKAAVLYSQQKKYEEAAEVYARAAEIQAEMNGEMDPENAEILFLYGRTLFKVGQGKSDVLGGKAPEGNAASRVDGGEKTAGKAGAGPGLIASAIAAGSSSEAGGSASTSKTEGAALDAKKPLFQFAGDEEWEISDEEDAADVEDEENVEEEEDDLAVAFEILDLSRVLFEKQLAQKEKEPTESAGADDTTAAETARGKAVTKDNAEKHEPEDEAGAETKKLCPSTRHIMERLADTHDLLAEISLENERYPNAIVDSRASLAYKQKTLPEESEIIAEAHFKLSLALEFASVTTSTEADGAEEAAGSADKKGQQVDQELRDEAARELEAAIVSTKLKLQNKEVELATVHSPEDNESTRRQITEVKEIIADMEQRLVDLRKPPIDINEAVNGAAGAAVGGLLGALGGAAVEEAKKGGKGLTGLVRKKAKDTAPAATTNGNGTKRKADTPSPDEEESKKARTADECIYFYVNVINNPERASQGTHTVSTYPECQSVERKSCNPVWMSKRQSGQGCVKLTLWIIMMLGVSRHGPILTRVHRQPMVILGAEPSWRDSFENLCANGHSERAEAPDPERKGV